MILNCEQCKDPFERNTPRQKYCSNSCKQKHFFQARNETYRLKTIELEEKNGALHERVVKASAELDGLTKENVALRVTIRTLVAQPRPSVNYDLVEQLKSQLKAHEEKL